VLLSLTFLLNSVTSSMPPASAQPLIGKTQNALAKRTPYSPPYFVLLFQYLRIPLSFNLALLYQTTRKKLSL
jgi:hypothetical protein